MRPEARLGVQTAVIFVVALPDLPVSVDVLPLGSPGDDADQTNRLMPSITEFSPVLPMCPPLTVKTSRSSRGMLKRV